MCGDHIGLSAEGIAPSQSVDLHGHTPAHRPLSIAFLDPVHGLVEIEYLVVVPEQVDLMPSTGQVAETNPYESDPNTPVVKVVEQIPGVLNENVVTCGIGDLLLLGSPFENQHNGS